MKCQGPGDRRGGIESGKIKTRKIISSLLHKQNYISLFRSFWNMKLFCLASGCWLSHFEFKGFSQLATTNSMKFCQHINFQRVSRLTPLFATNHFLHECCFFERKKTQYVPPFSWHSVWSKKETLMRVQFKKKLFQNIISMGRFLTSRLKMFFLN